MTPDDLADAGRLLYGERWRSALARDIRVADRTLDRWMAGTSPMPADLAENLRALLDARGVAIAAWLDQMSVRGRAS